jgi:Ser/Thr protein kinase RdoA (MazF antagonist)
MPRDDRLLAMSTLERDASQAWPVIREVWPNLAWAHPVYSHGAFHHVAVLGSTGVVRVSFADDHEARISRQADVLQLVGGIGLRARVPQLIGTVSGPTWSAMACTFVAGHLEVDRPWHEVRAHYADVLDDLATARVPTSGLPPARAWCGGSSWPEIVERVTASCDSRVRDAARSAAREVLRLGEAVPRSLVHGDFGAHNTLWDGLGTPGLIDFDNACAADPAIDVAPLVGFYGAAEVREIVATDVLARAKVHRASLPLQVAAAAALAGDRKLRDHAVSNFARRFEKGTLHDPAGA